MKISLYTHTDSTSLVKSGREKPAAMETLSSAHAIIVDSGFDELKNPPLLHKSQKSGACRIHLADVNALVWFSGWNLVMLYIIPVLVLAYMYYHIILALKKSISLTKTMRSNGKQTDEDHNDSDIKDRKQVITMLLSLMAIFVIAWGPYHTHAFYLPAHKRIVNFVFEHRLIREVVTLMSYSSATLNAVLVPIFSKQFRIAFARIFQMKEYVGKMTKPADVTMTSTLTAVRNV
ncbi:hypothetical protein CAPTEDRAFT_201394 [Capitella teleta]|uniref:G-protein coupled receptors family 1 profile domain-containing protein n=1 Tax=Capitella teleta TaxID=283909 RepID=R7THI0_CAPTE|nr:hypothetical protein CAPTEDRAFT_201394 [Capitella teleta]|eukprot:ELT93174.1 hypothetical protein CAPTEDRAFT_201394 [Capitella teleta]